LHPGLTAGAEAAAPHPASRHRVFAPGDGTVLYREIDNFGLMHPVMFDSRDELLDQLPRRQEKEMVDGTSRSRGMHRMNGDAAQGHLYMTI
jgi:hypothetical protein